MTKQTDINFSFNFQLKPQKLPENGKKITPEWQPVA